MSSKKKDDIWKDPRFAHLITNPRFKQMPTSQQKVKIDKRFKGMFDNDKFKVKFTVDKYGRQVNKTSTEDLKKYYDLSSEEENEEEEESKDDKAEDEDDSEPEKDNIQEGDDDTSDEEEAVEKDAFGNAIIQSDLNLPVTIKDKLKNLDIDYIRGEGVLLTDSSSDEEDTDEEDEIFIEHVWGELDRDTETTDDSSKRLAAMNMDWDRIRAVDIMVLCASFIPAGSGSIISVKIFPSDFGKERMAQEEIKGPQELTNKVETDDTQVDEEDEAYKEKLREYQLNRLRYYYAVIEFDSIQSADVVYKECDGLEYESTANRLDLRFIPDDMEFEDEPKDACTELPGSKYQPRLFFTTALQQAKVELTWDENDVDRVEIGQKLFTDKRNEISENQLRTFVACSSSEEEDDEEVEEKEDAGSDSDDNESLAGASKKSGKNKIDLYKSLLLEINQKEEDKKMKQVEMEFTWGVGDDKKKPKNVVDEVAVKKSATEGLTPFEKILEKKKDKKKAKKDARKKKIKAQMNSGSEEDEDDNENGYSTDEEYSEYLNDPYFAEEFANKDFEKPKKKKKVAKKQDSDEEDDKARAQKELELLLDDGEEEKAHFSLKKIQDQETMSSSKRKRHLKKSKKELQARSEPVDNFELNVKDNRFAAVYTAPEYNIDPTDPSFKKTKGMEVLIQEKLKRRYNDNDGSEVQPEPAKKSKTKDVSLNLLVKNIKRKVANNKK